MDCNETKRLLGAYVDDELELSHQLDMEAHLAACSTCKKVVEAAINFRFSVRMNMPAYKATSGARKKNSSCVTNRIRILARTGFSVLATFGRDGGDPGAGLLVRLGLDRGFSRQRSRTDR